MSKRLQLAACLILLSVCLLPLGLSRGAPDTRQLREGRTRRATVKGKIVFAGPKPDLEALNMALRREIDRSANKDYILKGGKEEVTQQTWKIDSDGGVAHVFVWLKPPGGFRFEIDQDLLRDKTWPDEVVLDQPRSGFTPHALVLFPSYYDGARGTRQRFKVKNSSAVSQGAKFISMSPANSAHNFILAPGKDVVIPLKPDENEIRVGDTIHPWKTAYIRVFDHPFATVSGADGSYQIKGVPEGELRIVAWHEAAGFLTDPQGDRIKVAGGAVVKNFSVRLKEAK